MAHYNKIPTLHNQGRRIALAIHILIEHKSFALPIFAALTRMILLSPSVTSPLFLFCSGRLPLQQGVGRERQLELKQRV